MVLHIIKATYSRTQGSNIFERVDAKVLQTFLNRNDIRGLQDTPKSNTEMENLRSFAEFEASQENHDQAGSPAQGRGRVCQVKGSKIKI